MKSRIQVVETWGSVIQKHNSSTEIEPVLKTKTKDALLKLKTTLGDEFLNTSIVKNTYFGQTMRYFTHNPPLCRELVQLATMLDALGGQDGFDAFLSNMKRKAVDPTNYSHDHCVLTCAYKFLNAGYDVIFEVPQSGPADGTIDFVLSECSTGEKIYVEVTVKTLGVRYEQANEATTRLNKIVQTHLPGFVTVARLHACPTPEQFNKIDKRFGDIATIVKRGGAPSFIFKHNMFSATISPSFDSQSTSVEVNGPPFLFNDAKRIKGKIKKEKKQLPFDEKTLIICRSFHPIEIDAKHTLGIVRHVKDDMTNNQHVSGVIIYSGSCYNHQPTYITPPIEKNGDEFYIRTQGYCTHITDDIIVLINKHATTPLSKTTQKKILCALDKH